MLKKLKSIVYELDLDLKSVNFNSYQNVPDVYSKTSTLTMFSLERKDTKMLYIAVPDCKHAFAKEFKASDVLVGKLEFTGSIEGGQYKVIYTVPSLVAKPKDRTKKEKSTEKNLKKRITSSQLRFRNFLP